MVGVLDGEMDMSGYTPGPWTAVEYLAGDCWHIRYGNHGNWLAEVVIDGVDATADARLIAAAPELLEAAMAMIKAHDEEWPTGEHDARMALRAAIRKATEAAS